MVNFLDKKDFTNYTKNYEKIADLRINLHENIMNIWAENIDSIAVTRYGTRVCGVIVSPKYKEEIEKNNDLNYCQSNDLRIKMRDYFDETNYNNKSFGIKSRNKLVAILVNPKLGLDLLKKHNELGLKLIKKHKI